MTREDKLRKIMKCLDKWLSNQEEGKHIVDYLNTFQVQGVGIYGYGILGKHLVRELQNQEVSVSWVMDRSASGDMVYGNVTKPDDYDNLADVDLAIIATVSDVEEVEGVLLKFVTGKIISVEELIDSVYVWGNQN
jgi:hypothetical protein